MSAIYRYPGVKPFEVTDAPLFFGRERDQEYLFELVNQEKLIILFGKSGYGKSSLVKAGLIPALINKPNIIFDRESGEQEQVFNCPVYIRFNLYAKGNRAKSPCDAVIECFIEQNNENVLDSSINDFFKEKGIDRTLWTVFKSSKGVAKQRIFLIFDQFEEFFSYPIEEQLQFRQQLSDLLYTRIPQTIRNEMDMLDRAVKRALHQPMEVRALIIIRSDRIHQLNSMREELPAILHTRYELKALNERQAKEAIVRPAQLSSESFILKMPFEYEPAALTKIISELSNPSENTFDQEEKSVIETFQLQMVCQTIEQNLISRTTRNSAQPTIVREIDLPDFNLIYEQYYTDKLTDLPNAESRRIAHILLEEVMVVGENMADIRRVSMDKFLLEETMQRDHRLTISQDLMDYLENKFLIRRETIGGRIHYEVSHDVLLPPLLKSRDEARLKASQELAQQAKAKRLAAERQRRRVRLLVAASLLGFVLVVAFGSLSMWAFKQKSLAEGALIQLMRAERELNKFELYKTISDMEIILSTPNGCPDRIQTAKLDSLPSYYPEDRVLQNRVKKIRALIRNKSCQ